MTGPHSDKYGDPIGVDADGNPNLVRTANTIDPEHATGALLGLAVGDALGTTLEFKNLGEPSFSPALVGPHVDISGGGPFAVAPGQVTDDTQMATALARSLMEEGGFVAEAVGAKYAIWAKHAFDIGNQTRSSLSLVARGTPALEAGRKVWIDGGRNAAGNGSLMRTAPLGVFYDSDDARRREVSMLDAAITHYDPRCQLACAAFNGAIASTLEGEVSSQRMLAAAESDLAAAATELAQRMPADATEIASAKVQLASDLAAARADDPGLYTSELHLGRMQGYVRVAFRLAFWQLMHAPSFEAGLIDVVNRGGDADTNGAITGALLGARYGASAIPRAWRQRVMAALEDQAGPWATTYHPRELLALLAWDIDPDEGTPRPLL